MNIGAAILATGRHWSFNVTFLIIIVKINNFA